MSQTLLRCAWPKKDIDGIRIRTKLTPFLPEYLTVCRISGLCALARLMCCCANGIIERDDASGVDELSECGPQGVETPDFGGILLDALHSCHQDAPAA